MTFMVRAGVGLARTNPLNGENRNWISKHKSIEQLDKEVDQQGQIEQELDIISKAKFNARLKQELNKRDQIH